MNLNVYSPENDHQILVLLYFWKGAANAGLRPHYSSLKWWCTSSGTNVWFLSEFITCYFVSCVKYDNEVQSGTTKTGYFLKSKNLLRLWSIRFYAFKMGSTNEKLTSECSKAGSGIGEETVMAFHLGVSQPMFALANVNRCVSILLFAEPFVWIKRLWGVQEDLHQQLKSVSEAKLPMGKRTAHPDIWMGSVGSVFALTKNSTLHPYPSWASFATWLEYRKSRLIKFMLAPCHLKTFCGPEVQQLFTRHPYFFSSISVIGKNTLEREILWSGIHNEELLPVLYCSLQTVAVI